MTPARFASGLLVATILGGGCASRSPQNVPRPVGLISEPEVWIIERAPTTRRADPADLALLAPVAGRREPLPLIRADVSARVAGHIATVDLSQQFRNPHRQAVDATYRLPLPDDAAISDFVLTIGQRSIRGIVRAREQARALYAEARAAGHPAVLIAARENVFEHEIANIAAGAAISTSVRYFHTLPYDHGWFELSLPTAALVRQRPPSGVWLGMNIEPGLKVQQWEGLGARSPQARPAGQKLALDLLRVVADEDVKMRWKVAAEGLSGGLAAHRDFSGRMYFSLLLIPPQSGEAGPVSVEVEGAGEVEMFPRAIGRIQPGRPRAVTGRCRQSSPLTEVRVIVEHTLDGKPHRLVLPIAAAPDSPSLPGVWAQRKIRWLWDRATVEPVPDLADQLRRISLEHGLVCDWTALVMVDATQRAEDRAKP